MAEIAIFNLLKEDPKNNKTAFLKAIEEKIYDDDSDNYIFFKIEDIKNRFSNIPEEGEIFDKALADFCKIAEKKYFYRMARDVLFLYEDYEFDYIRITLDSIKNRLSYVKDLTYIDALYRDFLEIKNLVDGVIKNDYFVMRVLAIKYLEEINFLTK